VTELARQLDLVFKLAFKAKELTQGMLSRTNRFPDVADYESAFRKILSEHDVTKSDRK